MDLVKDDWSSDAIPLWVNETQSFARLIFEGAHDLQGSAVKI
jgi:hypothetical protein